MFYLRASCMSIITSAYSAAFVWNALWLSIRLIWTDVLFKASVSYFLVWIIYPLMQLGYYSLLLLLCFCQILPLCLSIFTLFKCPYIEWIHTYNCNIFLLDRSFYHFVMSLSIVKSLSWSLFCLIQVLLSWIYVFICIGYLFPSEMSLL